MPSLPSVPTSNVEREEEDLELPGVPDHQPQVDIKVSLVNMLMGMLIDGHVGHVDGHGGWHGDAVEDLDNDTIAGGEGEEGGESGIGGQLKLFPDTTIEHFTNSIWTFCQPQQCQILIITPARTQARYIIYQTGSEIAC